LLDTGTNFPAVNLNSLLAMAIIKRRQRWNGTGVPPQSHPQAACLTLSACNISHLRLFVSWDSRDISLIISPPPPLHTRVTWIYLIFMNISKIVTAIFQQVKFYYLLIFFCCDYTLQ
jgi:hypothetical protein